MGAEQIYVIVLNVQILFNPFTAKLPLKLSDCCLEILSADGAKKRRGPKAIWRVPLSPSSRVHVQVES